MAFELSSNDGVVGSLLLSRRRVIEALSEEILTLQNDLLSHSHPSLLELTVLRRRRQTNESDLSLFVSRPHTLFKDGPTSASLLWDRHVHPKGLASLCG